MTKRPTIVYPTKPGYYLVSNVVDAKERLDGADGEGPLTIYRVATVHVMTQEDCYWRGDWKPPGVYVSNGPELEHIERAHGDYAGKPWKGLCYRPLDLAALAASIPPLTTP